MKAVKSLQVKKGVIRIERILGFMLKVRGFFVSANCYKLTDILPCLIDRLRPCGQSP